MEKLYERIRTQEDQETNFTLNATLYEKAEGSLWKTCWSRRLGWYYGGLFVLLVVLTALRHGYLASLLHA